MYRKLITAAQPIDAFRNVPAKYDTASYRQIKTGEFRVTVMTDDGWEEILSHHTDRATEAEAIAYLTAMGFEKMGAR